MAKPFIVACRQEATEPTMIFIREGREIFVNGRNLMDGTTLKHIEEEVRQAAALHRQEREECGCAPCLAEL